ncbi:MAG TPA: ABC transporter substrate-binding protein [Chloroflexia bacterium]|nr:ABC transporter substrate-binding protein [Chloroflexia bacterium]
MNRARKSWAGLILVGLMLSLMLAACGSSPTAAPAAGQSAAGQAASGNSGAPVDLNVWLYASAPEGGPPPADWVGFKMIKDKLNINLKFTMIPQGADGDTKLSTLAASNDLPDLFQLSNSNRSLLFKFAQQGLLAPTDSLLPMMPERTKARYSDENLKKLDSYNGTVYGLQEPASGSLYKRTGLYIRQDWLDKLGLKAPTTLDEFMKVAQAFTTQDPDGNGKNDTYGFGGFVDNAPGMGTYFDFIFGAFGVPGDWTYGDPSNFDATYKQPAYEKAMQFIAQLNQNKVIDPDWPTLKVDDFRARWKQGKYGMFVEDFCALSCQANYKAFDTNNPKGKLTLIAPPKGPDGKSAVGTFTAAGNNWIVSKKAMDAGKGPAIAKFLEWANSGEGYYLLGFGQKDINYKLDSNNNIVTTGIDPKMAYNSKEQQPILQMKWLAYNGADQELHARYAAFQTSDGRNIDPLEYYKASFNSPYVDATAGQLIQPAANSADISRYIGENLVQFALGQKPINDGTWKTFVDGFNGLGFADYENNGKQTLKSAGFLK